MGNNKYIYLDKIYINTVDFNTGDLKKLEIPCFFKNYEDSQINSFLLIQGLMNCNGFEIIHYNLTGTRYVKLAERNYKTDKYCKPLNEINLRDYGAISVYTFRDDSGSVFKMQMAFHEVRHLISFFTYFYYSIKKNMPEVEHYRVLGKSICPIDVEVAKMTYVDKALKYTNAIFAPTAKDMPSENESISSGVSADVQNRINAILRNAEKDSENLDYSEETSE